MLTRTIRLVQCRHCLHVWPPKVDIPLECPKCKRYDWREPATPKEKAHDTTPIQP